MHMFVIVSSQVCWTCNDILGVLAGASSVKRSFAALHHLQAHIVYGLPTAACSSFVLLVPGDMSSCS